MSKIFWKPSTILAPVPAVFIGCGNIKDSNIMTASWTGIVCTDPAMTYVSIRPQRYSYGIIKSTGEFTINLATKKLCRALDTCGVLTGKKVDKFKKCFLTAECGINISAPVIKESPLTLECKVTKIIPLGSHDMFLASIVSVDVEENLVDERGKLCLNKAGLVAYSHGEYMELGKKIGSFGFSVRKKKNK